STSFPAGFTDVNDKILELALRRSAVAPHSIPSRQAAPTIPLQQTRPLANRRSGIQAAESTPVGAGEPGNRLRFLHLVRAGIVGVDLGPEIVRQIGCKRVPPNLPVAKRILIAPSLRIMIDTARRYCDAFQSIWLDVSISLAELPLEAHPGGNFLR